MVEELGFAIPNLTDNGAQIVASDFAATTLHAVWQKRKHLAIAGQVTYFDIAITSEIKLEAGEYGINNFADVHEDDFLEMAIIDKDDVIGLFATYGMVVGTHVLELHKFVKTEYPDELGYNFITMDSRASDVTAGLYLRCAYHSFGTVDINFHTRILWDE